MKLVIMMLLIGMSLEAQEPARDKAGKGASKETEAAKTKQVQTPLGPSLRAVSPEGAVQRRPIKADPNLKIEEVGDTLTFRRQTPFGEQVWRRQRSELTDIEKEMMAARDRSRSGTAAEDPKNAASANPKGTPADASRSTPADSREAAVAPRRR